MHKWVKQLTTKTHVIHVVEGLDRGGGGGGGRCSQFIKILAYYSSH